jgi:mono/diheme cytochrome c family protein
MMRAWRQYAVLFALLAAACGDAGEREGMGAGMQHSMTGVVDTTGIRALAVPAEHQRGRELFDANCASCHGEAALGTELGPPLVHIIYEPNHHGDAAFILAAERGVRAHHWRFGDMPPQPGISREEVLEVVGYVRWLQRQAGVF